MSDASKKPYENTARWFTQKRDHALKILGLKSKSNLIKVIRKLCAKMLNRTEYFYMGEKLVNSHETFQKFEEHRKRIGNAPSANAKTEEIERYLAKCYHLMSDISDASVVLGTQLNIGMFLDVINSIYNPEKPQSETQNTRDQLKSLYDIDLQSIEPNVPDFPVPQSKLPFPAMAIPLPAESEEAIPSATSSVTNPPTSIVTPMYTPLSQKTEAERLAVRNEQLQIEAQIRREHHVDPNVPDPNQAAEIARAEAAPMVETPKNIIEIIQEAESANAVKAPTMKQLRVSAKPTDRFEIAKNTDLNVTLSLKHQHFGRMKMTRTRNPTLSDIGGRFGFTHHAQKAYAADQVPPHHQAAEDQNQNTKLHAPRHHYGHGYSRGHSHGHPMHVEGNCPICKYQNNLRAMRRKPTAVLQV